MSYNGGVGVVFVKFISYGGGVSVGKAKIERYNGNVSTKIGNHQEANCSRNDAIASSAAKMATSPTL